VVECRKYGVFVYFCVCSYGRITYCICIGGYVCDTTSVLGCGCFVSGGIDLGESFV
jgi:hypothetical protein